MQHLLNRVKFVADENTNLATIFWNFSTFQHRFNLPQVQQNLMSNEINFAYELLYKLPNNSRLRNLEIRKYEENLKIGWSNILVSILFSEVKYCQKQSHDYAYQAYIKVLWSCSVLLDH